MLSIFIVFYTVLAYNRNTVWRDEFSLWDNVVHGSPDKARAYNNRGNAYAKNNNLEAALADYNKAIGLDPEYGDAYFSRATVYLRKKNPDPAIADFNKALEIYDTTPEVESLTVHSYNNRAGAYEQKGDLDRALADYSKAIEMSPGYAAAYNNRAVLYLKRQEYANSWQDVHMAQALGCRVNADFIAALQKLSGREK